MNGTSGIDVDPVAGEVYMCQQRGSPRVSVWDEKSALVPPTTPATRSPTRLIPARRAAAGKLLRSWGDGVLDTPHAVRIKQPMHAGDKVEIWITDMGADPGQGHVVKAFTPTGDLLATIGRVGNNGTGLDPLQFGNVVSHRAARAPAPLCASQLSPSLTTRGFAAGGSGLDPRPEQDGYRRRRWRPEQPRRVRLSPHPLA